MSNSDTTVVTVTYGDRGNYLSETLRRCFEVESVGQAIVVSNGSRANFDELQSQWREKLTIVKCDQNVGSAPGYAMGISKALGVGSRYIWLLDDDNAPVSGALRMLHEELLNLSASRGEANCAVVGFRAEHSPDVGGGMKPQFTMALSSAFLSFHLAKVAYKAWFRLRGRNQGGDPGTVDLPYSTYGGLLAARSLFARIGTPMPELVLYADDTEYTLRMTRRGGILRMVVRAKIEDLESSWNTRDRRKISYLTYLRSGSDWQAYYGVRNRVWLDRHRLRKGIMMYYVNKMTWLLIYNIVAMSNPSGDRRSVIAAAIKDGEAARLGLNPLYPLP